MSVRQNGNIIAGKAEVNLYSTTGQHTDGAMTQKVTTDALNLKQNITDNTLTTTSKTIVGAINELDAKPSVSSFADLTGEPTDNTKLASALNAKSQVTIRRWS